MASSIAEVHKAIATLMVGKTLSSKEIRLAAISLFPTVNVASLNTSDYSRVRNEKGELVRAGSQGSTYAGGRFFYEKKAAGYLCLASNEANDTAISTRGARMSDAQAVASLQAKGFKITAPKAAQPTA